MKAEPFWTLPRLFVCSMPSTLKKSLFYRKSEKNLIVKLNLSSDNTNIKRHLYNQQKKDVCGNELGT